MKLFAAVGGLLVTAAIGLLPASDSRQAASATPPPRTALPCELGTRAVAATPVPLDGRPLLGRRPDGHLQFGFNDQSAFQGRLTFAEDRAAHQIVGSTLLRWTLLWGQIERVPGVYDWSPADQMYCNALKGGIRPVLVISSSPRWASLSVTGCLPEIAYCHGPPARRKMGALQRFARAVAIRYPQAAAIEAWNEPNLDVFWARPAARRYVQVLRAIYTGVKQGNPSIPVIGGNLGVDRRGMSIGDFLNAMYGAGAARWMDALGFHPYPGWGEAPGPGDRFHTTLATVRSIVASRDRPGRRLWVNELGVALVPDRGADAARQATQARSYYDELDASKDVDAVIFHTLIDDAAYGWIGRQGRSYVARPALCALAQRYGVPPTVCPGPLTLRPNP